MNYCSWHSIRCFLYLIFYSSRSSHHMSFSKLKLDLKVWRILHKSQRTCFQNYILLMSCTFVWPDERPIWLFLFKVSKGEGNHDPPGFKSLPEPEDITAWTPSPIWRHEIDSICIVKRQWHFKIRHTWLLCNRNRQASGTYLCGPTISPTTSKK